MCFQTNSGNIVSGYDCELKDKDIVFTSGKRSEKKESVSGGVQSTRDNRVRTDTFVRNFHYSTILPARVQFWYFQQQQIATLKRSVSYMTTVTLNAMTKEEFASWIENSELSNCRVIIHPPLQILIQTDASRKGYGAVSQGIRTGGLWSKKKQEHHISLLELLAIKFALLKIDEFENQCISK